MKHYFRSSAQVWSAEWFPKGSFGRKYGNSRVIETWLLLAVLKVPIGGDGSNIQYFQGFVGGAAI